ncbi:right-handed parallel beta-helix repeat-containing protein [bacterium]|nr:right-handed parallel beta-helix repeat-containing protein [bacterium]
MFQKMLSKAFTTTIIIGLIMSLTAVLAGADTPVGGFIRQDTTWMADDSPYEMIASIIVEEGITLTIEPNVTVKVAGQYALQIKGGLVARGTETKPIIFTAKNSTTPGSWGYIKFEDSSMDAEFIVGEYVSGLILQYCTVEYAGGSGASGAVWADSASPFIDNCVIRQNAKSGLYLNDSASVISNNKISGNNTNGGAGGE